MCTRHGRKTRDYLRLKKFGQLRWLNNLFCSRFHAALRVDCLLQRAVKVLDIDRGRRSQAGTDTMRGSKCAPVFPDCGLWRGDRDDVGCAAELREVILQSSLDPWSGLRR